MKETIRFAIPGDASSIWHLICGLAAYEKEPDAVEATPESLRSQMLAQRPSFECLIAEDGKRVVGFALFFQNDSTWRGRRGLYLEDLFVLPQQRGKGIGKALLAKRAAIAVERNCARVEWSVLDWNKPAIDFYASLGARPMNGWTIWRLTRNALDQLAKASQ